VSCGRRSVTLRTLAQTQGVHGLAHPLSSALRASASTMVKVVVACVLQHSPAPAVELAGGRKLGNFSPTVLS
jgi:hypothetical protein